MTLYMMAMMDSIKEAPKDIKPENMFHVGQPSDFSRRLLKKLEHELDTEGITQEEKDEIIKWD